MCACLIYSIANQPSAFKCLQQLYSSYYATECSLETMKRDPLCSHHSDPICCQEQQELWKPFFPTVQQGRDKNVNAICCTAPASKYLLPDTLMAGRLFIKQSLWYKLTNEVLLWGSPIDHKKTSRKQRTHAALGHWLVSDILGRSDDNFPLLVKQREGQVTGSFGSLRHSSPSNLSKYACQHYN